MALPHSIDGLDQVEGVESAMSVVRFPAMRRETIDSVARLSDATYQKRVWIMHEFPHDHFYDALGEVIHWLFDDMCVLPEPGPPDGDVLLPGDEIQRLAVLGTLFDPLIDRLGDVRDEVYLADPQWPRVIELASRCLPALILAGGWEEAPEDADNLLKIHAEGRIPTVERPATRRRVIRAVAALGDDEYQQRTWTGATDAGPVTGSFESCLHTLVDDTHVLPEPAASVGQVLLAGDEVQRMTTLWELLEPLRDRDSAAARASDDWPAVTAAARHCLAALVIAGAWIGPDTPDR
jgi:hypothetical protein